MIGPLMFFGSLALAARDIAELGLSWIGWAAIGGGIFFVSSLAIIYGQHKENIVLREQLAARADKRKICETLGNFLAEGKNLRISCSNEKESPPDKEIIHWNKRLKEYLETNLGSDYVASFESNDGLPIGLTSIVSPIHRNLDSYMRARLARIQQFLAELRKT